jgi:hypothetical protein
MRTEAPCDKTFELWRYCDGHRLWAMHFKGMLAFHLPVTRRKLRITHVRMNLGFIPHTGFTPRKFRFQIWNALESLPLIESGGTMLTYLGGLG